MLDVVGDDYGASRQRMRGDHRVEGADALACSIEFGSNPGESVSSFIVPGQAGDGRKELRHDASQVVGVRLAMHSVQQLCPRDA
jgi:hypothetical protein